MFFSYFFLVISSFYICCYVLFVKRQKKGFLFHIVDVTKIPKSIERIIDVRVCIYLFILLSNNSLLSLRFFMIRILPIVFNYIHTHTKGSIFVLFLLSRKILCFHPPISVFIQTKKIIIKL